MIKKIKLIVLSVIATALVAAPILMPAAVYAASTTDSTLQNGLCQGASLQVTTGDAPACTDSINPATTQQKVNDTITWVINIFSIVVGVAAVIMIIIGGLRYIISGGDSGNVTSAKNTILYAIIGLVVVALAQFIVKFVLSKLSNQG
jgi:cytochrome bd-type quinol oxidase subunit 2